MSQDYFARRVTLTNANQAYRLSDLVSLADPTAPISGAAEVYIENPADAVGNVARGDAGINAMNYGKVYQPGDGQRFQSGSGSDLTRIFVFTDTAGAQLFVEIRLG